MTELELKLKEPLVSVNTKTVDGRRKLHFETLDEMLADAEQLATGEVRMLGNWSLAQVFKHLAEALNSTIDGSSFRPSFFVKVMAKLFMRKKFIYGEIPPGFSIPEAAQAQFLPRDDTETQAALDELRSAVQRLKSTDERAAHPFFGELPREESDQFQLRHAELHLSFAVPTDR